jgi:hypothetical protein
VMTGVFRDFGAVFEKKAKNGVNFESSGAYRGRRLNISRSDLGGGLLGKTRPLSPELPSKFPRGYPRGYPEVPSGISPRTFGKTGRDTGRPVVPSNFKPPPTFPDPAE